MTFISVLRLINIMVALVSIMPVASILFNLVRHRKNAQSKSRRDLMAVFTLAFSMFALAAVYNAILSFLLYIGFDFQELVGFFWSQVLFNLRNILVNISFLIVNYGVYNVMYEDT